MKRKLIRILLMTVAPVVVLFGGYHIAYHMGQLTNYLLLKTFGVQLALYLPLVGIFGLVIVAACLFGFSVVIKLLWILSGNAMEWYDSKMAYRQAARDVQITEDREEGFRASLRRNFRGPIPGDRIPGGEALRHHPTQQVFIEEVDEDQQYRQRIGVEE